MTWLRLYTEVRHDRKLRRLPPEQRWLWIVMLAIAKESPKPGWILVSENVPMTVDDIADEAAIEVHSANSGIEAFLGLGMLEQVDGSLHVVQWDKRQFVSDNATQRWKKWKGSRQDQQGVNIDPTLDQRLSQQPANVEPTVPDYRVQSIIIASKDYKKSMLSASPGEQGKASPHRTLSAPDGAVHSQDLSIGEEAPSGEQGHPSFSMETVSHDSDMWQDGRSATKQLLEDAFSEEQRSDGYTEDDQLPIADFSEQVKRVTASSQDAPSVLKVADQIAIERSSPPDPYSTTLPESEASKTRFIDPLNPEEPGASQEKDPQEGDFSEQAEQQDEAAARGVTPESAFFLTKRKRKLSGWKLETFEEFWKAFAYRKGRAEAADAWLDIPNLSRELAARIIAAARQEAKARQELISKGQTPKWPQGWLSGRRWEDWEEDADSGGQGNDPGREEGQEKEQSQYRRTIQDALKRFV